MTGVVTKWATTVFPLEDKLPHVTENDLLRWVRAEAVKWREQGRPVERQFVTVWADQRVGGWWPVERIDLETFGAWQ